MTDTVESIREQTMLYVEAQLPEIQKADGFWNDITDESVSSVFKTVRQIEGAKMPFLIVSAGDEDVTREGASFKKDIGNFEIDVVGYAKSTDKTHVRRDMERLIKDVRRKLYEQQTKGGIVWSMTLINASSIEGSDAYPLFGMIFLTFVVKYDYEWTAP